MPRVGSGREPASVASCTELNTVKDVRFPEREFGLPVILEGAGTAAALLVSSGAFRREGNSDGSDPAPGPTLRLPRRAGVKSRGV